MKVEYEKIILIARATGWAYFVFLTAISLLPVPEIVLRDFNDLVLHCLAYGLLMWWFIQAYTSKKRYGMMAGFIGWGVVLEIMQGMTSYRTFEMVDMVANSVGVLLGLGLANAHRPIWQYLFK